MQKSYKIAKVFFICCMCFLSVILIAALVANIMQGDYLLAFLPLLLIPVFYGFDRKTEKGIW